MTRREMLALMAQGKEFKRPNEPEVIYMLDTGIVLFKHGDLTDLCDWWYDHEDWEEIKIPERFEGTQIVREMTMIEKTSAGNYSNKAAVVGGLNVPATWIGKNVRLIVEEII